MKYERKTRMKDDALAKTRRTRESGYPGFMKVVENSWIPVFTGMT
jgi:hypothetical protein